MTSPSRPLVESMRMRASVRSTGSSGVSTGGGSAVLHRSARARIIGPGVFFCRVGRYSRDMDARLLIVSNRLPVTVKVEDGHPIVSRSVGGLTTGLQSPHDRSGGLWIGWPGDLEGITPEMRADVDRQLAAERAVPICLSDREVKLFYEQDRKSTRLNSCHGYISYAVFCLKKKKNK